MARLTFPFRWEPAYRAAALPFGVAPGRAAVFVDEERFGVDFGPWRLRTRRANVAGTEVTGPYAWVRTAGPARLSLRDRGVTFATNAGPGLCVRFHTAVRAIDPLGLLRHPGVTVTVDDVDGLALVLA